MATSDGIVTMRTAEFDARVGGYQELAMFAVVTQTPSETTSVTDRVVEDVADLATAPVDSDECEDNAL